ALGSALVAGRNRLRVWWARPAWALPVAGANLRAVDLAAAVASELGAVGTNVVTSAQVRSLAISGGRVPTDALARLDAPLQAATSSAERGALRLDGVRTRWLVGPVSHRLRSLSAYAVDAERSAAIGVEAERLGFAMLGGDGTTRRYFLALVTPSELRGATALIGNFGEIDATGGRIRLARFGRIGELAAKAPKTP